MADVAKTTEQATLKKYGLRWAVLAAWTMQLESKALSIPPATRKKLHEARVMLTSGCYSSCGVSCALNAVEGSLMSVDSSTSHNTVNYWTELLAQSMSEEGTAVKVLSVPSVEVQYSSCKFNRCECG